MNSNRICPYCGANNSGDSNVCELCNKPLAQNAPINVPIIENKYNIDIQDNKNEQEAGDKLGTISLLLYFAGSVVMNFILGFLPSSIRNSLSVLSGLCPLSGIIIMIIGRIKYPTNKYLKTVMWIIIGTIILGLVLFIILAIMCANACSDIYKEVVGNTHISCPD